MNEKLLKDPKEETGTVRRQGERRACDGSGGVMVSHHNKINDIFRMNTIIGFLITGASIS